MANLIIGHSQVKYFENYLSVMNTKCEYYSGCLIEDLLKESSVKKLIPESQVVAVLCGINNLPRDDSATIIDKFNRLFNGILELNPSAKVILSTILPRDRNLRSTGRNYTEEELLDINETIGIINEALQKISYRYPDLYVVEHPQFLLDDDFINDDLLAADGLHLSFEGTPIVVSNIESAILEVRRDLLKEAAGHVDNVKQTEVTITTSGEKLPYSDVVRYGEERPQPVIVSRRIQRKNNKETKSKREQNRRQRPNNRQRINRPCRESMKKEPAKRQQTVMKPTTSVPRKPQREMNRLSNRFSVLEVEESVSDDCDEDVIPSLPRPMLGGGSINKTEKQQDKTSVRLDNPSDSNTSRSQITVEIITSAATNDESAGVKTKLQKLETSIMDTSSEVITSATTDDESVCVDIPSVNNELQELETSIRDTNDENDVNEEKLTKSDIQNAVRSTKNEIDVNEEPLNNSDLEIIQLLNCPDKISINEDQTNENLETVLKSVKLFEGQTFSSYEEFKNIYEIWCRENSHPMKTDSSYKNDEECNDFPYRLIRFACKHAGKPRLRGEGKRPMQAHFACECPVVVRLKFDKKGSNYTITKLIDDHNHTTSHGEFKHYTTNRKLNDEQRDDVKALIDLQVETKNIKTYMREKTGKVIQTKDILNIKQTFVRQKEGGLTKGQLLAAALNDLANNKQAITYIQLDEDQLNVELVYLQTMEMKEHFRKYPDILFMDTTYNVNLEGYPLFAILAEDGDGRGKPVAYCYLKSESKENMQKVLETFCEYNDVKDVRIIMVDKDLNEINAIKEYIPNATVLLCKFHVMKYFKKKVSDLDIKHDEKKSLGLLLQQMIDSKDQYHYDTLYKELQRYDSEFVQYFDKNWHSCQNMWVIHFRSSLQTHGNNTNNKIESHNQKLKHYLTQHMHLHESVSNLALFIDEAFTKSSYTRFSNLKTKIDYRNTDEALMQFSLLCNAKAFGIVVEEYKKYKSTKYDCSETDEMFTLKNKASCHTVSKLDNTCDCTVFMNFGLPCRHVFISREKQGLEIYNETLIPNRWRKEFEPVDDDTDIHVVQTSTLINKRKKPKANPKTTIDKFNKAIVVCRDLATFLSTCGENEFLEKMTVLKKLHANWQSSQETIDTDENLSNANTIPINASKELIKFAHQNDTTPNSSETTTDDLLTLPDNQNGNNDDRGYVSTDNVDTKNILSETASDELPALTKSQDDINDDKESVSTESSQEKLENITIFDIMKNVNVDKIKSRRGRPKGSKKPFWSFSSQTKPSGKKRKRNSENETKPNMNKTAKTAKTDDHSDISLSSSPQSKQETPWIETTRFTLTKHDKDEIEGKCQLTDKIIEAAQSILKQQFPNLNGFQSTLFKQNIKHFKKEDKNMIQILHRGTINSGHWVTISTVDCQEGQVNWFDSLFNDLDVDTKRQICAIMKPDGTQLNFLKLPVQNQIGGADCGLFAIAFAVAICFEMNPSKVIFVQEKMRSHLIECLENQKFCNFPFNINTNWKKKKITKTKENIYCKCRGLYDSEMVQCVACEAWLHHRCIDKSILKQIEEKKNFVFQCC